jgi:glycosyltransferase involved in cell wall biosynthesis
MTDRRRENRRAPVRLLTVSNNFYAGGTERHVVTLARKLDGGTFEQHLACLHRQGEFLEDVEARGIPLTEYPIARLYGPRTLRQQFRLASYLRSRGIQIVHTYGFYSHAFAIPAARLARTPVIIASIRDLGDLWTPAQQRLQRSMCRLAHRVLTNAEAVKQRLVADGYPGGTIAVIRNGVDPCPAEEQPPAATLRQELGLPADVPLIAMVSRLNRARGVDFKGVAYFLDAAALVASRCPDARFLVLGDGPCREEFVCDARRRGLADRLIFVGFRKDVTRWLREVTVSVLPSLSEGLSNAILESMAAGVPAVATSVGGNPELIVDGVTGLLVPPRDAGALAAAICQLLAHPAVARRLGQAARQRALDHFSTERMVQETERLYLSLVRRHASATEGGLTKLSTSGRVPSPHAAPRGLSGPT